MGTNGRCDGVVGALRGDPVPWDHSASIRCADMTMLPPAAVRSLFPSFVVLCMAALVVGQDRPSPREAKSAPSLARALEGLAAGARLRGAGLAVGREGRLLHVSTTGEFAVEQGIPIASASKWLTVATILALVEEGLLDLDAPLSRYAKEFAAPDMKDITLRQCLSCTAGFAAISRTARDSDLDARACAAAIADEGLAYAPATEWRYGGVTFQAAACAAVLATGKDWHELFASRIARPLGMAATKFGAMTPPGEGAGQVKNPWVAGGAVSSLRDYERFCAMLSSGGKLDGVRVLRKESVDAMLSRHTDPGKTTVRSDSFAEFDGKLEYGLGTWIQQFDSGSLRCSDPGAFGFLPWIDRDLGVYGVLATQARIQPVMQRAGELQDAARAFVGSPSVAGRDEVVRIEHGGRTRSYRLHVPPGVEQMKSSALLFVFHGGGGNAAQAEESTGFSRIADREKFCVVYPDGTGYFRERLLTWNSGGIPVYAQDQGVDDSGFVRAVLASVAQRAPIDADRVFATGMSNGAMMCHRLARECQDLFAGIAPVSGAMNFTAKDGSLPLAVMIVHGTKDEHVLYDGGKPRRSIGKAGERVDASVAAARDHYLARNAHRGEPKVEREGDARIETWTREAGLPVRIVTIEGGGHAWPGGPRGDYRGADEPDDWPASTRIWEFFAPLKKMRGPETGPR